MFAGTSWKVCGYATLALCAGACAELEPVGPYDADRRAQTMSVMTSPLSPADVEAFFFPGCAYPCPSLIDEVAIYDRLMLIGDMRHEDAYLATFTWLRDSSAYWRDSDTRLDLIAADPVFDVTGVGVNGPPTHPGLTSTEYLEYLRIVSGLPAAGTPTLVDLKTHLYMMANFIFNTRQYDVHPTNPANLCSSMYPRHDWRTGTTYCDIQWSNTVSLHRENWFDELVADELAAFVGGRYGTGWTADPLRARLMTWSELEHIFGSPTIDPHTALRDFVELDLGLSRDIAQMVANQYTGPKSLPLGGDSHDWYGMRAFVAGRVQCHAGSCDDVTTPAPNHPSFDDPGFYGPVGDSGYGHAYATDPLIAARMGYTASTPVFGPLPSTTYSDIVTTIHDLVGHGTYTYDPVTHRLGVTTRSATYAVFPDVDVTAFELQDVMLALGNALPNENEIPFSDLLPPQDRAKTFLPGFPENAEMDFQQAVFDYMDSLL